MEPFSHSVSRSIRPLVTKLDVLKNKSVDIRAYINVWLVRHREHTVLLFINIQLNTFNYSMYTLLFCVAVFPTCFGSYRAIFMETEARERKLRIFAVTLKSAACASVFIHGAATADIVYIYSVLLIHY